MGAFAVIMVVVVFLGLSFFLVGFFVSVFAVPVPSRAPPVPDRVFGAPVPSPPVAFSGDPGNLKLTGK